MASIIYGPNAVPLAPWAENLLASYADELGIPTLYVSSTFRTPADQARAMLYNLVHGNEVNYGANGTAVQKVGRDMLADGWPQATIQLAMEAKINEIGPEKISHHMDSTRTVVDVEPSKLTADQQATFVASMNQKHSAGKIGEWLYPKSLGAPVGQRDPAFHIELLESQTPTEQATQAAENAVTDVAAAAEEVTGVSSGTLLVAGMGLGLLAWVLWG